QRNWIGRSTGAEVDFFIGDIYPSKNEGLQPLGGSVANAPSPSVLKAWKDARRRDGFPAKPGDDVIRIYTTRPDTLFGATYMVLAPEHPLVDRLTTSAQRAAVNAYRDKAAAKSDLDRTELAKSKTGVFTGSHAVNPVNSAPIPIWIADYVLMSYGTGAIMAVPGHDERDFEFATEYRLPIIAVVDPGESAGDQDAVLAGQAVFTGLGVAVNSGTYNGLATDQFKQRITADLTSAGVGRQAVNYKLRDWLFSRQRFWGEPFPILHELDAEGRPTGVTRAVPEKDLPVDLPHLDDFKPHGRPEPPLEKAPQDWLYPTVEGRRYKRETNTMPQWAGSCWYYLRFLDPENTERLIDPAIERAWMPVNLYIGGAEHAVLHLLYARFWHKVLFDRGAVSSPEPFIKLVNQGMILGEIEYHVYRRSEDEGGDLVSEDDIDDESEGYELEDVPKEEVEIRGNKPYKKGTNLVLTSRASKMSKSRGNVVTPDAVVAEYGADALRLYEMFMGPLEATKPWSMEGVSGVRNFLDRVWRMIINDRTESVELNPAVKDVEPTEEQNRVLHKTIKAVTDDLRRMAFNTAIARLMEFTNFFTKSDSRPRVAMEKLVLLLSPLAPHIAEELWQALGHGTTLAYQPWPAFDAAWTHDAVIEVPVQVNGKLRGRISVEADADEATIEAAARADEKIALNLAGKQVVKVLVVRGRLVNFVVK
ncbi:MAG: leucine--tRNA ligase, partial [Pirellulales bacterium]